MISLEALAEFIESGLNEEQNLNDLKFTYANNATLGYEFRIVADTTDYHKPNKVGNDVTAYIHGILFLNGSNIETSKGGATNATLDTTLELAVPVLDGMDDEGNKKLVSKVRAMLDEFFKSNGNGSIQHEGTAYSFGYEYNLSASGVRNSLPHLGDAYMFRVLQSWVFLPNGITSDDLELRINGNAVPFSTIGIMRSSVQESEIPSNSTNAAAKNVTASTQLSINVGMTAIIGPVFNLLRNYILSGALQDLTVSLTVDGNTGTYTMQFNDGALNGQIPLYASATFKLVEVL